MSSAPDVQSTPQNAPQAQAARRAGEVHFEKERGVSEVSLVRGIVHVTVCVSGQANGEYEERLRVLEYLASQNVPVFLVKILPGALSFALRGEAAPQGLVALKELQADFSADSDLALLSTHAGAMRDLSGVMADIYEALSSVNARVKQTGDAYNAVLCLVPGDKARAAQAALRKRFALPEDEPLSVPLDSAPVPRPAL